jgi:hypothetical protein
MSDRIKDAVKQINREIDLQTGPPSMSQNEALEILEQVASDVEAKIDALKDEMK